MSQRLAAVAARCPPILPSGKRAGSLAVHASSPAPRRTATPSRHHVHVSSLHRKPSPPPSLPNPSSNPGVAAIHPLLFGSGLGGGLFGLTDGLEEDVKTLAWPLPTAVHWRIPALGSKIRVSELTVVRALEGTSGPLLVRGRDSKAKGRWIFKQTTSEPYLPSPPSSNSTNTGIPGTPLEPLKRGVQYGQATRKEVAAYLLDHGGFAGVPMTSLSYAKLCRKDTNKIKYRHQPTSSVEHGSLQTFVPNLGTMDDFSASMFKTSDVHPIGILDLRLFNLDRHGANLLVSSPPPPKRASPPPSPSLTASPGGIILGNPGACGYPHPYPFHPPHPRGYGAYRLVPVDHAYSLPDFRCLSDAEFEWRFWRQAKEPFSPKSLRYISDLDPLNDAAIIKSLGLPDSGAITSMIMTHFVKQGASAGLTLSDMAAIVERKDLGETKSNLEGIIDASLASETRKPLKFCRQGSELAMTGELSDFMDTVQLGIEEEIRRYQRDSEGE